MQNEQKLHFALNMHGASKEDEQTEATALLKEFFDNGSLVQAVGLWNGTTETSYIFTVITKNDRERDKTKIKCMYFSERVRSLYKQECLFYTEHKIKAEYI